jgi:hypothetical protein
MKTWIVFNTAGKTAIITEGETMHLFVERSIKPNFPGRILEGPARPARAYMRGQIIGISAIHTIHTIHLNQHHILRGTEATNHLPATTSLARMEALVPPIGMVHHIHVVIPHIRVPEEDINEGVTVVMVGIHKIVMVATGALKRAIRTAIIRRLRMGEGEDIERWISIGCLSYRKTTTIRVFFLKKKP